MLDRKKISGFKRDELVKVDEAIEEDANLLIVLFELAEMEVTLLLRLDHIVHLAQEIHK